jgi:hypothetical protein
MVMDDRTREIRELSFTQFIDGFFQNVRFENCIYRGLAEGRLPFRTIGDYLDADLADRLALLRIPNLGRSSLEAFDHAIQVALLSNPSDMSHIDASNADESGNVGMLNYDELLDSLRTKYPLAFDDFIGRYHLVPEDDHLLRAQMESEFRALIEDERAAEVAYRRFMGETLEAIGNSLDLTRERVRQIESWFKPLLTDIFTESFVRKAIDALSAISDDDGFPLNDSLYDFHPLLPMALRRVVLADRSAQGNAPLSGKEQRLIAARLGMAVAEEDEKAPLVDEPIAVDIRTESAAEVPRRVGGNMLLVQWLSEFLDQRKLTSPDRRMLYGYNVSAAEFESLESVLVLACLANKFSVLVSLNVAFPALFVLFASEWWKREYEGGAWAWDPMVERLAGKEADVSQQTLSECVTVGLQYWGHQPQADGKRFLGAIVAQGGIPMRLLAQGEGKLPVALAQTIKFADRYNWTLGQIQEAVDERLPLLPQSYRRQEIAKLLADFATAVVELKQTHQLGNVTDPIAYLDQIEPDWKRRFPISLEHDAAQTLLVGLVREVATQRSPTSHSLFRCERRLIESGTGEFELESVISAASRADADDFASLFGLNNDQSLPRYFTVDLTGQSRREFLDGRPINGAVPSAVRLLGSRLQQRGDAAMAEHALVLRAGADVGATVTVGGELPADDPWVFMERDGEVPRYMGAGSVRLPDASALVVMPTGWEIGAEATVSRLGVMVNTEPARTVFRVEGSCTLASNEITYRLRLTQTSDQPLLFQWSGSRLPDAADKLVFKANDRLRLYKSVEDRLVPVPASDQVWRRPGSGEILAPREARGPIEVRVMDAGETVSRQRVFVLPAEARVAYQTDPDRLGRAAIRFENWGQAEFGVAPHPGMTTQVVRKTTSVELHLDADGDPPGRLRVQVHWPGCPFELMLDLPYPSTGGRFVRVDGEPFAQGQRVGIEDLLGTRLRVFDTNPAAPKSYAVQLALQGGRSEQRVQFPIRLDITGHAEVRLIDYQRNIVSLLGMTDRLDAVVVIRLLVGEQPAKEIHIARYIASLDRDGQHVALKSADLSTISLEKLRTVEVCARPLVEREADQVTLPPKESEGTPTGSWLATGLDRRGNPWLIYPGQASALQFRPMVWITDMPEGESQPTGESDGVDLRCPLAQAMLLPEPDARWNALHDVIKVMGIDPGHPSWSLVLAQWSAFKHLPLPALDLWRMVAKQPRSVVTLLLNAGLPESDVPVLARRLRDEVGWWPELTSLADWHDVLKGLWVTWSVQLPPQLAKQIFLENVARRFAVLRSEFPALEVMLDLVEFEMTGRPSEALDAIWSVCDIRSDVLVRSLWQGPDSIGIRQLLQVNTDRDDSDWCEHRLMEDTAREFASVVDKQAMSKLHPRLRYLFKEDIHPKRLAIANMPMLCALWATLSVSKGFWVETAHRVALRRVRDFDPIWFEQGYRHAVAALLTIDGLIEPTRFIDLPD